MLSSGAESGRRRIRLRNAHVAQLSDEAPHALLERDSERGWRAFVDTYTTTLLALIERAGVTDRDDQRDVYVRVCERLADRKCARLRGHDPLKGALAAWLTIVVRHAVVDWVRSRAGRRRLFGAIERLGEGDQRIFELYYWDGRRAAEIAEVLSTERRERASVGDVLDALERIGHVLSERHRFELLALVARSHQTVSLETDAGRSPLTLVELRHNPETVLAVKHLERTLSHAIAELPAEDAAIVRLMFVQGWARHEIQRALHLKELTRERVRAILTGLRARLEARGIGAREAATPGLAFLEDDRV